MENNNNKYNQISFVIKHIPQSMGKTQLEELGSHFGKVESVYRRHGTYSFINFKNLNIPVEDVISAFKTQGILAMLKEQQHSMTNGTRASISIDPQAQQKALKCVYCNQSASKICGRCSDHYCSSKCQSADWENHRYICFPMPELLDVAKPMERPKHGLIELSLTTSDDGLSNISSTQSSPKEIKIHTKYQEASVQSSLSPEETTQSCSSPEQDGTLFSAERNDSISYLPQNGCLVTITAIKSINVLFVRLSDKKTAMRYQHILKKIDKLSNHSDPIEQAPPLNSMAAAKFQNDGLMYRVRVISTQDSAKVRVKYIDFGNEDVIQWKDMKKLPEECQRLEILVFEISLLNVQNVKNSNVLKWLWSLESNANEQFQLLKDSKSPMYEMINQKTGQNLNAEIAKMLMARPPVLKPPFTIQLLPIGKNVCVHILDNSLVKLGLFSACKESDATKVEQFSQKVQTYGNRNKEAYTPQLNEYCLAKFPEDGLWYRGQVLNISTDNYFLVCYIDFGNEATVTPEHIRYYPAELTEPCRTSRCLIEDLPDDIPQQNVEVLKEVYEFGKTRMINEIAYHEDGVVVVRDDTIQSLRSDKLIV